MFSNNSHCKFSGLLTLALLFSLQATADSRVYTNPLHLYPDRGFELLTRIEYIGDCGDNFEQTVDRDGLQIEVRVSLTDGAECGESESPSRIQTLKHRMPALPAGRYEVKYYYLDNPTHEEFSFQIKGFDHPLSSRTPVLKVGHETPAPNQIVSGIGLIRGWACVSGDAPEHIEYQIDEMEKQEIPFGSSRPDTESGCYFHFPSNSSFNGYGAIVNWNALPPGQHRLRLWVGDTLQADHQFTIASTQGEFLRGLSRDVEIEDFPGQGDKSIVRWSEANQNFIIIGTQAATTAE